MKITGVDVYPVTLPYPVPYGRRSGAKTHQESVIIKMLTDEGLIGLGEAVNVTATGRKARQAVNTTVLVREYIPQLIGEDPLDHERLLLKLGGPTASYPGALHAIDLALWDLKGKYFKLPVYKLLGGKLRDSLSLSRSLPAKSPGEMAERALELKEQDYALITVKIGYDPAEDLQRIKAVREAVGDYPLVECDVNEGYDRETAIPALRAIEPYLSGGIEQPVAGWDLFGMAECARALDAPIIADQSFAGPMGMAQCIRLGAGDVMCLKLPKEGGITYAWQAALLAQSMGVPCATGSSHPLGVGTAALHHFTIACPWVRPPIGYGSPLERLGEDVTADPVVVHHGQVAPRDLPGLGVELDEARLKQYAVKISVDHN